MTEAKEGNEESNVHAGGGKTKLSTHSNPVIGDGKRQEVEKTSNGDTCPEEMGIERADNELTNVTLVGKDKIINDPNNSCHTPPNQSKEKGTPVNVVWENIILWCEAQITGHSTVEELLASVAAWGRCP
ncbi:hypothetical protein L2E82_18743 [Cichorium intybus]|uniref:Uncharacterized protein n=1 Tax=Cichorium intybus TaxID=13427 RepID=A0ACB9FAT2_CICIN|nr:hypothetical protein L2E82_18743 [Cichorium intybus]